MGPIVLGQKVVIRANGKIGQVRGIWQSITGETLYRVLYADYNARLWEDWLTEQDCESVPKES